MKEMEFGLTHSRKCCMIQTISISRNYPKEERMVATIIIVIIIIVILLAVIVSYRKKITQGCCGAGGRCRGESDSKGHQSRRISLYLYHSD